MTEGPGDKSNGGAFTAGEVRIAAALVAYIETPSSAAEAELLAAAPGAFGGWLRDIGDAYPGREGSAWASATPSMIRDAYIDWCGDWRTESPPDELVEAMRPYVEEPTAERQEAVRRAAPNDSAAFWVDHCDALRERPGSAWGGRLFGWERRPVPPRSRWRLLRGEPRWTVLRGERRWTARVAVVASVAAAALVLIAAFGVFPGGTPPPAVTHVGVTPVAWRITSFINQPAWQSTTPAGTGNTATNVTCPSSLTCYAAKEGTGEPAVVEVSVDGGLDWQPSTLPAGWQLTSSLTCPSPAECLAGASTSSGAGIVVTTDGGITWSVHPLPASVGQVTDLACGSVGQCVAAGYGPTADPGSFGMPIVVPLSVAGGISGAVVDLPQPFVAASPGGLACAAAGGLCVLVGVTGFATRSSGLAAGTGAVFRSTDGGRTWSRTEIPAAVARVRTVSCPSVDRCVGVGNGRSSAPGPDPYGPSEALTTGDGGQTWSVTSLSELHGSTLASISCPATTTCWATGRNPERSGVIVATDDGGRSWSTVQLPTTLPPAQQRDTGFTHLDIENVSSVSCPTVGTCVALAVPTSLAFGDQQIVLRDDDH